MHKNRKSCSMINLFRSFSPLFFKKIIIVNNTCWKFFVSLHYFKLRKWDICSHTRIQYVCDFSLHKKIRQHVKLHDKEPSKQRLLNSKKLSRNADTQKTSNKILFIFCSLPCAVGFGFNELISGGNDHLYLAKHFFVSWTKLENTINDKHLLVQRIITS